MTSSSLTTRRLHIAAIVGGSLYVVGFLMVCVIANGVAAPSPFSSSHAVLMIGMALWNVGTICLLQGLRRSILLIDKA